MFAAFKPLAPPPNCVLRPLPEPMSLNLPVSLIAPTKQKSKVTTSSEKIPFKTPPPKDAPTLTKEENDELSKKLKIH